MKDELGKKFGKKEFFETLIITIITLFLVCIAFLFPTLFLLELLVLVVFLVAVFIIFWQKKKK
jgi:c-di-AMP phosphodiesterase-like protein